MSDITNHRYSGEILPSTVDHRRAPPEPSQPGHMAAPTCWPSTGAGIIAKVSIPAVTAGRIWHAPRYPGGHGVARR
jgi:hypothetical protein